MTDPTVRIAVLETEVKALTKQVEKLTAAVEGLTEIMNRGKGAFAASMCLAGTIGAGIMKLLSFLHFGSQP